MVALKLLSRRNNMFWFHVTVVNHVYLAVAFDEENCTNVGECQSHVDI
jgi:hypothetical protein